MNKDGVENINRLFYVLENMRNVKSISEFEKCVSEARKSWNNIQKILK